MEARIKELAKIARLEEIAHGRLYDQIILETPKGSVYGDHPNFAALEAARIRLNDARKRLNLEIMEQVLAATPEIGNEELKQRITEHKNTVLNDVARNERDEAIAEGKRRPHESPESIAASIAENARASLSPNVTKPSFKDPNRKKVNVNEGALAALNAINLGSVSNQMNRRTRRTRRKHARTARTARTTRTTKTTRTARVR
jgi:hypothetical protein